MTLWIALAATAAAVIFLLAPRYLARLMSGHSTRAAPSDGEETAPRARWLPARSLAAPAILCGWIILGAVALYAVAGRHKVPVTPIASGTTGASLLGANGSSPTPVATLGTAPTNVGSVDKMNARLEARLEGDPTDASGWQMLGWSYFNTGHYAEAESAYAKAVALRPDDAELLSLYGETLVRLDNGLVSDSARESFRKALAIRPDDPRARFFLGMALEQDGDPAAAIEAWIGLIDSAAPGAAWAPGVIERIRELASASNIDVSGRLPASIDDGSTPLRSPDLAGGGGPSAAEVQAALEMTPQDRQEMIRGMVDSLEARLMRSPDDPDGWVRLIRSRVVLGEADAAVGALRTALAALEARPDAIEMVTKAAAELGVTTN